MSQSDRPAEKEAVRTTIVGGRPPGCGQDVGAVPRGLEVLMKKAAVDPAFKQLLIEKRAGAAQAIRLTLEPAEALMLAQVPAAQLESIIARTKVREIDRAAFLGQAAALMLAALGAGSLSGCGQGEPQRLPTKGVEPDRPEPAGIRSDRPMPKKDQPTPSTSAEPPTPPAKDH
ncbi:MAG: hypothetical protein ABSE73_14900 [Planctomycetota bacterium]